MGRSLPGLFAILLLALGGFARAADDPRALIRRAIDQMGGKDLVARKVATHLEAKGKYLLTPGAGKPMTMTLWRQTGGIALRMNMQVEFASQKVRINFVMKGTEAWQEADGRATDQTGSLRESILAFQHQTRVAGLVPLLEEKGFTFTALPETKVDGRPARGIKVSFKDRPDVSLHFDKANGLLVKYGCRMKAGGSDKAFLNEVILSDYRLVHGPSDEQVLASASVGTATRDIVAFLKRQAPDDRKLARARALVAKLGADEFAAREKAEAELIALGAPALPFVRAAAKGGDLEVVRRAQRCLKAITALASPQVTSAAVRLLGLRNPPGTIASLLEVLPGADEPIVQEVRAGLADLAERDPEARAALSRALKDKDGARRSAAEAALGKDGGAYLKQPGRRILLPGLRQAMRQISLTDGKIVADLEIVEPHYFNRLDDKLFTKPKR